MPEIILYKRHSLDCEHQKDRHYRRCGCKVWLRYSQNGVQTQVSAKTRSWDAAQRQARELGTALDNGTAPARQAKVVKDAIQEFLAYKRAFITKRGRAVAPDTMYRHKLSLKLLQEYCDKNDIVSLKDVSLNHLDNWKTGWSVETAHARSSFQARVKNFFSWCHSRGLIAIDPTDKLDKIPVIAGEHVRALEPKTYERILAAIGETTMTPQNAARIKVLMQLQREAGLSLVDAVCLSKDELQYKNKTFRVVLSRQKTNTHVNNVIPTWLGEELLKVKNGNPEYFFWSGSTTPEDAPSYFQKLYRKVFEAAGIEGSSHDFRHTYAIELLKAGVDIRAVSKALGHSSVTVTEKYYSRWCVSQQANLDAALAGTWKKGTGASE